jgi:carboxyl-terminal processing protease
MRDGHEGRGRLGNRRHFLAAVLVVLGMGLGVGIGPIVSRDDGRISFRKVEQAYDVIWRHYVDPVEGLDLADKAIAAMLLELDPHSVYVDPERVRTLTQDYNGWFDGVGISFEILGNGVGRDTAAVSMVLPDGPGFRAGLLSGDRILSIDGLSAVGWNTESVERALRGPRGTPVLLRLRRPGTRQTVEVTVRRGRVPITTLDAAFMLDDRTGYIRLNRFARNTHQEFVRAARDLRREGMQRLIFDLRGNSGGYMDQATRIVDEFLPGGKLIVSSRSRHSEYANEIYSTPGGQLETQSVILLVDEQSASASEIVAGALQDHDRALVLGRRTYGKGLVQKQFSLPDESALRLTISRFITPSGRLIQTPYSNGSRESYRENRMNVRRSDTVLSHEDLVAGAPDSLKFTTAAGRVVLGGGGIVPDMVTIADGRTSFRRGLLLRGLDNRYAQQYLDENGSRLRTRYGSRRDAFISSFRPGPDFVRNFLRMAETEGLEVSEELWAAARKLPTTKEMREELAWLESTLRGRVAARLFDRQAWFEATAGTDPVIRLAMRSWNEASALASLYAGSLEAR